MEKVNSCNTSLAENGMSHKLYLEDEHKKKKPFTKKQMSIFFVAFISDLFSFSASSLPAPFLPALVSLDFYLQ